MKFIINGRFLTQKITGVQRCGREIVRELDQLAEPGQWEICMPSGAETPYRNIKPVTVKSLFSGPAWDYAAYDPYVKKERGMAVNFCNVASLSKPGVVMIHDVTYRVNSSFHTSFKGRLATLRSLLNYRIAVRNSARILTVSEFSKSEIMKYYHIPGERITVIPDAWQHMERLSAAEDTFIRFPFLHPGGYYYSLSTLAANKNFKWVLYAAKHNPSETFAIAGGGKLLGAAEAEGLRDLPNIHFLGYVSDEDSKTLMANCKAFLFPSLYEGFGLPPLEAAACGAPEIIVSDIPCLKEIYGGYARYINPHDYHCVLTDIPPAAEKGFDGLLARYSWKRSAERVKQLIEEIVF